MKKLSIILSLIILLFCTTAFVACGEESVSGNESATSVSESVGQEDENAEKPTYSGTNKLRIGMWSGIPTEVDGKKLTDEELLGYYRDLAASGITIASSAILCNSKEYNLRVLAAAEEVGIKQLIQDNDVTSVLFDVNGDQGDREQKKNKLLALSADYLGFKSFEGYFITDEPSRNYFEALGEGCEILKEALPDVAFYVNLLPDYASTAQLGNVTYRDYIDEYLDVIKTPYISYDYYVLSQDARGNKKMKPTYLHNLATVKEFAESYGVDMWTFGCTTEHMANSVRGVSNKADAAFQMYTSLAYGSRSMQWFCYWTPPLVAGDYNDAMIKRNGEKGVAYEFVSAVNGETQKFYHILDESEWQGILLSRGTEEAAGGSVNFDYVEDKQYALKNTDAIKGIKTSRDAIAGVYKDKSSRGVYMLANFADPSLTGTNLVELTLNGKTHAVVWYKGEEKTLKAVGGKITFELEPGEGALVIPY